MPLSLSQKQQLEALLQLEAERRMREGLTTTPYTDLLVVGRAAQKAFMANLVSGVCTALQAAIASHDTTAAAQLADTTAKCNTALALVADIGTLP